MLLKFPEYTILYDVRLSDSRILASPTTSHRTLSVDASSSVALGPEVYGHGGSALRDAPSIYTKVSEATAEKLSMKLFTRLWARIFGALL